VEANEKCLHEKREERLSARPDGFFAERIRVPLSVLDGAREEVGERPKRKRFQGDIVRRDGET